MQLDAQRVQEESRSLLACRCTGRDTDLPCERDASQEDGLCDSCRCEHGCCEGHLTRKMHYDCWRKRAERQGSGDGGQDE